MKRRYLIIFFLGVFSSVFAQRVVPNYQTQKVKDGDVFLRWEPRSPEEWKKAINSGYTVEKYAVSPEGSRTLVNSQKVKVASQGDFERVINLLGASFYSNFYAGVMDFIYDENAHDKYDGLFSMLESKDAKTIESFKLGLLSYMVTYDFKLTEMAALGFKDEKVSEGKYEYKVYTLNSEPFIFGLNSSENTVFAKPELKAEWSDHMVKIEWITHVNRSSYYGYFLEKSEDGINYTRLDSVPSVNSYDVDEEPIINFIRKTDSLEQNYKTYYYRVRCMDYFGDMSRLSSPLSGYGYDEIRTSPMIFHADQMDNNDALIEWRMPQEFLHLVDRFSLLRADSLEGDWSVVMDSLPVAAESSVRYRMEDETNHFRIDAIPKMGEPASSMPVFVMGMDTIAPVTPIILSAQIDTLGRIEIKWEKNQEDDLWGYKVFRGNFENEELGLLNATPFLDTIYLDTIDLKFDTKNVFYRIQAVDDRNNRSDFSELIKLEKPDILPPTTPGIMKLNQLGDTIEVNLVASNSNDVIIHQLFKREFVEGANWELIAELDSIAVKEPYLDIMVEYGKTYAYTLVAIDDVLLKSKPAPYKKLEVVKAKINFDNSLQIKYQNNDDEINLSWESTYPDKLKSVTVYKGYSVDKMSKYRNVKWPLSELSDNVDGKEKVFYKLKPHYEQQTRAWISDVIEVDLKEE